MSNYGKSEHTKKSLTSKAGITVGCMIVLLVGILLISQYRQPQNVKTNAAGTSATPCQSYIETGGTYAEGDVSPCVTIIKSLIEAAHTFDLTKSGLWTAEWVQMDSGPSFGQFLVNNVEGFQTTTASKMTLPWAWPEKTLAANGIVDLNTYKDLCTEDVREGLANASTYCSIILPHSSEAHVNTTVVNGFGQCMDDTNGSSTPGNKVQIYKCNNIAKSQTWTTGFGTGEIEIHGLCAGPSVASGSAGTNVVLVNCGSPFIPSVKWNGNTGELINEQSGLCLTTPGTKAPANGTALTVTKCTDATGQKWKIHWGTVPKSLL